ncbi:apolipo protein n-acyltransferase [Favolaschia claudopus]|uniref:Apolipo protein n-acyltransferase n=1 Tax=Favolaschia claudopus TaxID=2862362 RepID=A0AAW0EHG3_9AGAR
MAHFNAEAEPFEEIQRDRGAKAPSADELSAFYRDMERNDLERKLSKRKSSGSRWSRKSLRRSSTSQSQSQPQPGPTQLTSPSTSFLARPPTRNDHDRGESADVVPPMPAVLSRSIVPDRLTELPAWYKENSNHSARYPMHNPVGPRWYRNHHLVPPINARPSRPPSVFSPSFPPIASSGEVPTISRSASNSPLPTPNSSQTHVPDGQPRSRKTSQTARDNVDLLDVSDPSGAAWHHESPYDVGLSSSPASFEEHAHSVANPYSASRSRVASASTAQNRRKTVTPSPLSQSTSAVHLQVPEKAQVSRKLSKRRTVGIFGRHTTSAPTSPADDASARGVSPASLGPPSSFVAPSIKSERRGSVLGRIAKRFSVLRKPQPMIAPMQVTRQPSPEKRQPSPTKMHAPEPVKRVAPPLVHHDSSFVVIPTQAAPPQQEPVKVEHDRASSISFETELPYTMGRLTVANPDPGSVESTPVQRELSLPQEEVQHEWAATEDSTATTRSAPPILSAPSVFSIASAPSASSSPAVRTPEPPASNSLRFPNPPQASDNVVDPRSTASPPPPPSPLPPPTPEKGPSDAIRHRRISAVPRTSAERSSTPQSHRASNSQASLQSPTPRPTSMGRAQSPVKPVVEKPQPPPPSPPSPKLPAVPFPSHVESTPTPNPPPHELPHQLPQFTADISPLSVSSMLANPPTPYTPEKLMEDDEPEPAPPPVPSKRSSRDPSPSQVSVTGRETETFRLIRSASGTVYASSETIRAAGEQWEVVESTSRGKNRSQDRDSESRQRRQGKEKETDSDQPKSRSRKRRSADDNGAVRHRSPIPDALISRADEPKASRSKRDEERERKVVDLEKPQPAPPVPSRHPSRNNAVRPTSEVPTAEDMNQMKAREAWDMDRLWKARSMGGMEASVVAPPPMPSVSATNGKVAENPPALYGSSHTAFMVSTPFQPPAASTPIYHSMPPAPPPIVYPAGYASPNGYASPSRASPSSEHPSSSSNGISSRPPLANPLPEPPRESPYEPAPLTHPEYWGKHASATTAH